jgi:hypothetical protein
MQGYVDDGIEVKGMNTNVRVWENVITADQADTCFATNENFNSAPIGPIYIFRNTCRVTKVGSSGATGFKQGPYTAKSYIFHNSIDTSAAVSPGWDLWTSSTLVEPFVILNNAVKSSAAIYGHEPSTTTSDYNVVLKVGGGSYAYDWGGANYDTFSDFMTGTGQEAHGISADPVFTDTALHINATSPGYDRSVVIQNFNTQDGPWGYTDTAPDMGAFEVGGFTSTPVENVDAGIDTVTPDAGNAKTGGGGCCDAGGSPLGSALGVLLVFAFRRRRPR